MTASSIPLKRCTKCGEEFPPTTEYFRARPNTKVGLYPYCKACDNAMSRARYAKADKVAYNATKARWRANNRDKVNATARRWIERNPEKVKARDHNWRVEHPGYRAEQMRQWRHNNPEKAREIIARGRAKRRSLEAGIKADDIKLLYKSQNGKCWWCGCILAKSYHVDHRIPLSRGGTNSPRNLCLACPSCNHRKSNKLPHEWNGRLL